MSEKKKFRKQFWKDKKMIGAMSPSSKFLTAKMLENIDFSQTSIIVELGPGTGVFTEEILKKMKPDAVLLVFELNDTMFSLLKKKITDERVHLIHDSAEHIEDYLEKYHLDKADVVISSLPLAVFPDELRKKVLSASHQSLKKVGKYIQFQYSLQAKKLLKELYSDVSIKFTALNFPPAFIYTCLKK